MQKTNSYILFTLILAIGFLPGCIKERSNPKLRNRSHHQKVVNNAKKMYEKFISILQDELTFMSSITDTDPNKLDHQEELKIKRFIKKRIAYIHKHGEDISFWNILLSGDWVGQPFNTYHDSLSYHLNLLDRRIKKIKKIATESPEKQVAEKVTELIDNLRAMYNKIELLNTMLKMFFLTELNQEESNHQLAHKASWLHRLR